MLMIASIVMLAMCSICATRFIANMTTIWIIRYIVNVLIGMIMFEIPFELLFDVLLFSMLCTGLICWLILLLYGYGARNAI